MESLIAFPARYGLLAVFVGVLAEQVGASMLAFPLLVLAGMQALVRPMVCADRIRLSRLKTGLSHTSAAELAELLETQTEIAILDVQSPALRRSSPTGFVVRLTST